MCGPLALILFGYIFAIRLKKSPRINQLIRACEKKNEQRANNNEQKNENLKILHFIFYSDKQIMFKLQCVILFHLCIRLW